jgi:hypothetical protein
VNRDRATQILSRILATIDGGGVPVRIDGVWVFGSYARGALEPGDIDLIIVHEKMNEALRAELQAEAKTKGLDWTRELYYPARRHRGMITSPLRKPGEKVDILLGWSLDEVLSHYSTAKNGRLVRLWTPERRDWRAALASITPDPTATRAPRREFIACKRAGCSLQEMQRLTAWIERGAVVVERVQQPELPVKLCAEGHERVELLVSLSYFGKAARECVPLGAWWLERHGCKWIGGERGELNNKEPWPSLKRPTLRVTFGTLHPGRIAWFLDQPEAEAVAHVLHVKKDEPRELLEFRRGPAWAEFEEIDRDAGREGED